MELGLDNREAQVRGHGEVRDGADEQADGEEVVEDLLAIARLEAETEEDGLASVLVAFPPLRDVVEDGERRTKLSE